MDVLNRINHFVSSILTRGLLIDTCACLSRRLNVFPALRRSSVAEHPRVDSSFCFFLLALVVYDAFPQFEPIANTYPRPKNAFCHLRAASRRPDPALASSGPRLMSPNPSQGPWRCACSTRAPSDSKIQEITRLPIIPSHHPPPLMQIDTSTLRHAGSGAHTPSASRGCPSSPRRRSSRSSPAAGAGRFCSAAASRTLAAV